MIRNNTILINSGRISTTNIILILFLLLESLFISCNSDSTLIGESLQPPSELMNPSFTDTLSVKAFSFSQDSIRTSSFSRALIGSIMDPDFGSTKTSFLTRIRLDGTDTYPEPFMPGPGAMADSIVFYLLPGEVYGDPATKLNLKIYRLSEDIFRDSVYYSNHVPQYDPATEHSQVITMQDTLIRIVLDTTFFTNTLADVDTITTNAGLREIFKGIYITADSIPVEGEGAILQMDILSYLSSMFLYYRKPSDTLLYDYEFLITGNSGRINMISHDYSMGQISSLNDTITEDTLIYVQGLGGTYARIDFPTIEELNELGDIAINKAEISFKSIEYIDTAFYPPPDKLSLFTKKEGGEFTSLMDYNLGDNYFGGSLDEESGEYTFNITNHFKEYLTGDIPVSSVYLFVETTTISPERITLFNGTAPNNIRLRIIYTKI